MITLAAPAVPIASCATVLPSIRGIVIIFLFASCNAFLIASGTSFAFPIPNPTLPLRSPITTVAEYHLPYVAHHYPYILLPNTYHYNYLNNN